MGIILDVHGEELLTQYKEKLPLYKKLEQLAFNEINKMVKEQGIYVNAIEHRVKTEDSLKGKLELKGYKYHTIDDITDLVGLRVITFYTDEVDKVAAMVKHLFIVDWSESVDKRKLHETNTFGYNSLHYICQLPESFTHDPQISSIRFELQMRTALQHVWSTIEHDIRYKGDIKLPLEHQRQFGRLAGMMELIDNDFSRLRNTASEYRRQIKSLVDSGKLNEVPLNYETFQNYLETNPFKQLNQHIAAINQAEIIPTPLMPFLPILQSFDFQTLGDVEKFIKNNEDDAYQLAISQLAVTDFDILSESLGIQSLCFVQALKNGGGRMGIKAIYDTLFGEQESNLMLADEIVKQASELAFMQSEKKE